MQKNINFNDAMLPELDKKTIGLALTGQNAELHTYHPVRSIRESHCSFTVGVAGDEAVVVLVDPPTNRHGVSVTNHIEFIATELAVKHLPRFPHSAIRWYQIDKDPMGSVSLDRVVMAPPTREHPRYCSPIWQRLRGWRQAYPEFDGPSPGIAA